MQDSKAYIQNRLTFLGALGPNDPTVAGKDRRLGICVERLLVDRDTDEPVAFDGDTGLEALLTQLTAIWPGATSQAFDGHLMGVTATCNSAAEEVQVGVTLGPGGQLRCEVGPTASITSLKAGLDAIDRAIHVASRNLGRDYELVAEGYNPYATSALDVNLVPRARWTLENAFLGQTGRYSRDMMRCTCATSMYVEPANETEAISMLRLSCALAPLFMFLCDNVRSFRGSGARRCPRMVRSLIYEDVDPARCGVPGAIFDPSYSYLHYLNWLEGIQPILLEDEGGNVVSTGKKTLHQVMEERALTPEEADCVLTGVYPYARLGRGVTFAAADAMRPRVALGYAALVKALFCNQLGRAASLSLIGNIREAQIGLAAHELRIRGWDATVYGQRAERLVAQLLQIARSVLDDPDERRALDSIAELWEFNMVPRDAFVHEEERNQRGW